MNTQGTRMVVRWLGRPWRWGIWPSSARYVWIFDLGPVRFLRCSVSGEPDGSQGEKP